MGYIYCEDKEWFHAECSNQNETWGMEDFRQLSSGAEISSDMPREPEELHSIWKVQDSDLFVYMYVCMYFYGFRSRQGQLCEINVGRINKG